MLKIRNAELHRWGQSFLDEMEDIDWGDDRKRHPPFSMPGPKPPVPHGEPGVIGEDQYEQFEPGTLEEIVDMPTEPQARPDWQEEIPLGNELLGIPEGTKEVEYDSGEQLIYDGIEQGQVITFDYTNRFGQYAGTRTVEPHYTFIANTTGNEVLVTHDREQNDIRAFIVGNIHPYGVRYEGITFEPKGEIMRGIY